MNVLAFNWATSGGTLSEPYQQAGIQTRTSASVQSIFMVTVTLVGWLAARLTANVKTT